MVHSENASSAPAAVMGSWWLNTQTCRAFLGKFALNVWEFLLCQAINRDGWDFRLYRAKPCSIRPYQRLESMRGYFQWWSLRIMLFPEMLMLWWSAILRTWWCIGQWNILRQIWLHKWHSITKNLVVLVLLWTGNRRLWLHHIWRRCDRNVGAIFSLMHGLVGIYWLCKLILILLQVCWVRFVILLILPVADFYWDPCLRHLLGWYISLRYWPIFSVWIMSVHSWPCLLSSFLSLNLGRRKSGSILCVCIVSQPRFWPFHLLKGIWRFFISLLSL